MRVRAGVLVSCGPVAPTKRVRFPRSDYIKYFILYANNHVPIHFHYGWLTFKPDDAPLVRMPADCPTCGREFDGERGMRVHHAQAHGETLPNRECANCDAEFYSEEERKYCSEECRDESVSFSGTDHPNYRGGKATTECDICGDEFEYYPSEKPGRYCPDCVKNENWRHDRDISGENNPRWSGGKEVYDCDICGESFERYPSQVDGETTLCSDDCRAEWLSEAFTGDGHPNWRGGGNEAYGKGWAEIRRKALDRDDHACVLCGKTREEIGRNPDVHHIVPLRAFVESPVLVREDAHTLDNVVSLCVGCHRRAEFGHVSRALLRSLVGVPRHGRPEPGSAPGGAR